MSTELFAALDLPRPLHPLQDAYWAAERKWTKLQDAYAVVLDDMIRDRPEVLTAEDLDVPSFLREEPFEEKTMQQLADERMALARRLTTP